MNPRISREVLHSDLEFQTSELIALISSQKRRVQFDSIAVLRCASDAC